MQSLENFARIAIIAICLCALAASGLVIRHAVQPSVRTIAIQFNAAGCQPDGLALGMGRTQLDITSQGTDGRLVIQDEAGATVARSKLVEARGSQVMMTDLPQGYYQVRCGESETLSHLTVGTPAGQALDLGSVRASASKKPYSKNIYSLTNLVASSARYNPQIVDPDLVDAWGLANRPAGAGGHFWVTANKTGNSLEYVGDTKSTPLYQNDLRVVSVPGAADAPNVPAAAQLLGQPTGVVYNPYSDRFKINQGAVSGAAKFIFAGQDGTISAWTEQPNANGSTTQLAWATKLADRSAEGNQYFGLAISPDGQRLLAADFGSGPQIRTFSSDFKPVPTTGFANPFLKAGQAVKPGSLLPWNVTTFGDKVYVAYAAAGTDEYDPRKPAVAEENHAAGAGRVAVFDNDGKLLQVLQDQGSLDAPWGMAVAPSGFGAMAGDLLVANFGDGTVAAFKPDGTFDDWLRNTTDGSVLVVPGIWALLPGNGVSLGAADTVYFTAGPNAERDGVFGRINAR